MQEVLQEPLSVGRGLFAIQTSAFIMLVFLFPMASWCLEMGSSYIAQASLELPSSSIPPALVS